MTAQSSGTTVIAEVMYSRIIDALGRDIVEDRLPAGERLTIDGLQRRFGVSRTVVRDCMRILESMNLVFSKRRVGIVVQPAEQWNVYDARVIRWRLEGTSRAQQFHSLTELRCAVEPLAAAGAARNATAAQRAVVVDLATQLRRLGEAGALEEFMAVDIEFHALLLAASGNEMFSALDQVVAEVLRGRTHQGLMPHNPREHALATHTAVAEAVSAGNAPAAEAQMRQLLAEVREAIT
ncbi:FCD domain-containing protein [Arthrobacter sp. H5]|uniref:FadR/GntR family transcriptional regulator n=1 Tax=Arthrobacter sp. H5 TaxID=1267973 RepID=UPI00048A149A|nr:FCD domain-containing protein [Arthrobacter sp. H5]